ncbi:hypothetical protein LIER_24744 [Lithospermum erythrorhizon]|uniref:RRM domain-containing protein n=1 Tax=Lithospermum erythrorhizon TaxID=34254 RepID=A0AAV3R864_LITER
MDFTKKRKVDGNGMTYPPPGDYEGGANALPPSLSPGDADKIIESLSKEQLLPILRSALLRHPDVLDSVRNVADADVTQRKLFVRGLGWETTTESLRTTFSCFGEIEEAIVITDKGTGKSKGYGFVTFKHIDGAIVALKEPNKKIDGRITVTQLAAAGNSGNSGSADVSLRKIYVGNVPFEVSSERLLQYFSVFGEIEEGPLGFDKQTGKAKGFAFFVYKTEEGARASLYEPMKNLDGHQVVCKLATDNKKVKSAGPGMGQTGMPGDDRMGARPMPGSNFGVSGGYSGFQGGQGPVPQQPGMMHQNMGGPVGGGFGSQGGGYAASAGYGPGPGQYGSGHGAGGAGEYGVGLSHPAGYRMPPSSAGMPPSGGYQDGGNYGPQSGYGSQIPQPGAGPRIPPGGMYQGMPPYY